MMLPALAALAAVPARAQMPDGSANRAAIQRLSFMVGHWRGDAWMDRGGQRMQTTMVETVEPRIDGTVLLVEGRGAMTVQGAERVVHHALGVLFYDVQTNSYTLKSWIGQGFTGDFAVTVGDNQVSWTREVPGGRVRNTARYTANEWHEVGEFSADGTTWQQVMEIRLRRER
jgi:hypothetical protein